MTGVTNISASEGSRIRFRIQSSEIEKKGGSFSQKEVASGKENTSV